MPADRVRPLTEADVPSWLRMRLALWPFLDDVENEKDACVLRGDPNRFAIFVSESPDGVTGFVEAGLRQYAEGCETSPVGCIEGWFVLPHARRRGVGRALVAAAEAWARSRGCSEMASQALLENSEGQAAHTHIGYAEVERQVCYRKPL
jgi:aminoglycoside 6'-N-acetyltransferase I